MADKSTKNLTPLSKSRQSDDSVSPARLKTYQAGVLQASAHRVLQKYCDDVLGQYGLTKMHWLITGVVLDSGKDGISITELAQKLSTNLPYLTNTINLLESRNFLERRTDAKDERTKRVFVTPAFKLKCTEIERTLRNQLRKTIYQDVTPDELRVYMNVLYKLSQIEAPKK